MVKKEQEKVRPPELTINPELKKKVDELIQATYKEGVEYWSEEITETIYVPIDVGEIRVLHVKPKKPKNKRILLFLPGWGVTNDEFNDIYEILHEEVEFYYVETREKSTSRIKRWGTNLTVSEKAKDVQRVIDYFKLNEKDYFIGGPCWGSTVTLVGIKEKILNAPAYVVFDSAYKLTFSKLLIRLGVIVPAFIVAILKRILKFFAIRGMKEERQKERTAAFIDNAEVWKWKKSAFQNRNLNLFDILGEIEEEIPSFNGTKDKFHHQEVFPEMARLMPNGRFFYMEVDESERERLQGVIMREFAMIDSKSGIPKIFLQFEKELKRN
ncbi:MAG: hypothetical protein FK731_03920 [Asgard group archaeon]|nr:hypothetical protein [Asgard group archaeon]